MLSNNLLEGKYKIVKVLGNGGMGTVYLVENVKLQTLWAVKELRKDGGYPADILIEPNILKKLNHPALPRVFDILEDEHSIYLVIDYIDGITLKDELESRGSFPEDTVIRWSMELCDVLDYLHSQKPNPIIYRDMKPSNIMLTRDGKIKLVDFGAAREYKPESECDTVYIGTKGYAAPEQYGAGQTGVASDIYSLGVTMYHLLTGIGPNDPPYEMRPVRQVNPALSRKIEQVITKCTRPNPEERYHSVAELLQDLKAAGENRQAGKNPALNGQSIKNGSERAICFKKLIVSVIDNAEFACEMAFCISRITGLRVLLMDFDFLFSKTSIYLNPSTKYANRLPGGMRTGFNSIAEACSSETLDSTRLKEACYTLYDNDNLYILNNRYGLENYETLKNMDVQVLLETAYRSFDFTIAVLPICIYDTLTVEVLKRSDYLVVAAQANIDILKGYSRYLDFMRSKLGIAVNNVYYVAYEYKKGINLPLHMFRDIFSKGCCIGTVSYQERREKYRNMNLCYARWGYKLVLDEYIKIIRHFNILPSYGKLQQLKIRFIFILRKLRKKWRKISMKLKHRRMKP